MILSFTIYLCDSILHYLPVWCYPSPFTCVILSFTIYLCDAILHHLPVWYYPSLFTCVILSFTIYLCDTILHYLPVWYYPLLFTCVILSFTIYLCDSILHYLHLSLVSIAVASYVGHSDNTARSHDPYTDWNQHTDQILLVLPKTSNKISYKRSILVEVKIDTS